MENQVATAVNSKGSFGAVISATKAFIVTHPIGIAITGGALLGIGTYYTANKYLSKRKAKKLSL